MSSNCPHKRTRTAIINKWFDRKFRRARNLSFKYLNLFRKCNSLQDKNMYLKHKNKLRPICNNSKIEYYNKIIDQIYKTKISKEFWDTI